MGSLGRNVMCTKSREYMSGGGAQRKTREKDLEVKGREKIEDPGKEIRHEYEDVAKYGCRRHEDAQAFLCPIHLPWRKV